MTGRLKKLLLVACAASLGGCALFEPPPSEDPVLIKLTEIDERLQKVERLTNNGASATVENPVRTSQPR